jgi:hypothetical protein
MTDSVTVEYCDGVLRQYDRKATYIVSRLHDFWRRDVESATGLLTVFEI